MKSSVSNLPRAVLALTMALPAVTVLSGCPGFGIPGIFPPPGPGLATAPIPLPPGSDLPGTVISILSVNNGLPVIPGGPLSVQFRIRDRAGQTIPINQLDRFQTFVSGNTQNYQRVIPSEGDVVNRLTSNPDGSYTYTFAGGLPTSYTAPYNDSAAFGSADGELTGQPLQSGTYTVGIEARRSFSISGEVFRDAGDAFFDFLIGAGPPAPRQVVIESNCVRCHTRIVVHGENRFTVAGCVTCHTNGAEDRISADPAKATPGVRITFANLIHAIHRGAELPTVRATANSADPHRFQVIGFGEAVHDYSHVQFPYMPGGAGFNQQTRNCGVCHDGAAQGDRYYTAPSRMACTGCHNDLNFDDGTMLDPLNPSVMAGTLTRAQLSDPAFRRQVAGIRHVFSDSQCTLCHQPGTTLDARAVHVPPLLNEEHTNGLRVVIQSVGGSSGALFFRPGDRPVVTFTLVDRNNLPVNIADVASINLVLSGPVGNYQKILPDNAATLAVKGMGGVPTTGFGPFTYTSTQAIPANYPPPLNDSANFDFAGGWGELSGRPLEDGNYTLMLYAFRQFTLPPTTQPGEIQTTYRETTAPALFEIRIGSDGPTPGYPGFVSDAKCNACHGDLRFHGNSRKSVLSCVLCHTGGAEDRAMPAAGQTQHAVNESIDFKVMIHKIHAGRELDVVRRGGRYDLIGFGNNVIDFSHALLPTMPDGPAQCTACHANDAWKAPVERPDVRIWRVACTSCHDRASALAHVQLNTLNAAAPSGWSEACATCHGEGKQLAVDRVHRRP